MAPHSSFTPIELRWDGLSVSFTNSKGRTTAVLKGRRGLPKNTAVTFYAWLDLARTVTGAWALAGEQGTHHSGAEGSAAGAGLGLGLGLHVCLELMRPVLGGFSAHGMPASGLYLRNPEGGAAASCKS